MGHLDCSLNLTQVWSQEQWVLSSEQLPLSPLMCQVEPEQGFRFGFLCLPCNCSPQCPPGSTFRASFGAPWVPPLCWA